MEKQKIEELITKRKQIIDEIAQRSAYQAQLRAQIQAKIDALIPQELKDELEAIRAEFSTDTLQAQANDIRAEIEAGVLAAGETVKVKGMGEVRYNNGRVTWDGSGLEGASKLYPDLLAFRKVGKPYVSFYD